MPVTTASASGRGPGGRIPLGAAGYNIATSVSPGLLDRPAGLVPETILLNVTVVVLLGIGAQWAAWRLRLPSILLLLPVGFVAGPVLGLLGPQALQGDWFFAFVSLAVGILLFDAGLSVRLSELREGRATVFNLVAVGGLLTWGLAAGAAHLLLGFTVELAILIGVLLTMTGPTVVGPLLRYVRPEDRVAPIARGESMIIGPVGALLAVLTLETILLLNAPTRTSATASAAVEHVAVGVGLEVFVALGVTVTASALLLLVLRRRLVPERLRSAVTLTAVVVAFAVSNVLQPESGLLTTTLMGIVLANQPYVSVQRVAAFKEPLHVLLVGALFVLLSARLELSALQYIDTQVLAFLGVLVVLVRPLAVLLSTIGATLEWEERAFLAWLAPRGVGAVALVSLFAHEVRPIYPDAVDGMVPVVFAVVMGTVAIYGLTSAPLARWLDLADPNPNGLLFVGAGGWVRTVARHMQALGVPVMLMDSNPERVRRAREKGLPARQADALSASVLDEADLSGIGRLLVTLPNDEVASLTALHFEEVFDSGDIYQLAARPDSRYGEGDMMPKHLRGRPLFGEKAHYQLLRECLSRGDELTVLRLADDATVEGQKTTYTYEEVVEGYGEGGILPLFILRTGPDVEVVAEREQFRLGPDDRLVALVGTREQRVEGSSGTVAPTASSRRPLEVEDEFARDGRTDRASVRST